MFYFTYSINGKIQQKDMPFSTEEKATEFCSNLFKHCFDNRKFYGYHHLDFQVVDENKKNCTHSMYDIELDMTIK